MVKRNIGAISKVKHFVDMAILTNLYYSLVYPFLRYALVAWGNIYCSQLILFINPINLFYKKK